MNHDSVPRRLLSICAALLLLGLAVELVSDALHNARHARTGWQYLEAVIRFVGALLSIAVVVTRWRWPFMSRPIRIAWVLSVATAVFLSALVWGPPMLHLALVNVVVALLEAWVLTWALGRPLAA